MGTTVYLNDVTDYGSTLLVMATQCLVLQKDREFNTFIKYNFIQLSTNASVYRNLLEKSFIKSGSDENN